MTIIFNSEGPNEQHDVYTPVEARNKPPHPASDRGENIDDMDVDQSTVSGLDSTTIIPVAKTPLNDVMRLAKILRNSLMWLWRSRLILTRTRMIHQELQQTRSFYLRKNIWRNMLMTYLLRKKYPHTGCCIKFLFINTYIYNDSLTNSFFAMQRFRGA